jgi:hypothetical protein
LGGSARLLTKRNIYISPVSQEQRKKRLFDEITETLRRARVLAAKMALPKFH